MNSASVHFEWNVGEQTLWKLLMRSWCGAVPAGYQLSKRHCWWSQHNYHHGLSLPALGNWFQLGQDRQNTSKPLLIFWENLIIRGAIFCPSTSWRTVQRGNVSNGPPVHVILSFSFLYRDALCLKKLIIGFSSCLKQQISIIRQRGLMGFILSWISSYIIMVMKQR